MKTTTSLLLAISSMIGSMMVSGQEIKMDQQKLQRLLETLDAMPGAVGGIVHSNLSHPSRQLGGIKHGKKGMRYRKPPLDCSKVDLSDYPQWVAETGYWIGELTLLGEDGKPRESDTWPYRFDSYKGFITGNIAGNAYRQRNVFLYPPLASEDCGSSEDVVGEGVCGENGNSRVFSADQSVTTCSRNPELGGDLTGMIGPIETTTELVGDDNALLYQVFLVIGEGDSAVRTLIQSQLTTITVDGDGVTRRTRTAQLFRNGVSTGTSFYREVKVPKDEFYEGLSETLSDYNILQADRCVRDGFAGDQPVPGYTGGFDQCMAHLEQSFALGTVMDDPMP